MTSETLENPYPGARPLLIHDTLVGRQDLLQEFIATAHRHTVVQLVGSSGTGKSSFLQAGVERHLGRHPDWRVASIRDWSSVRHQNETDAEWYAVVLARMLGLDDMLKDRVRDDAYDFLKWVYDAHDDGGVFAELLVGIPRPALTPFLFVFDQFEELLTHEKGVGKGFLNVMSQLIKDHPDPDQNRITHVLSLRQEFEYELRDFVAGLGPQISRTFTLPPLEVKYVDDLVHGPLTDLDGVEADPDLVEAIRASWSLIGGSDRFFPDDDGIGLLHIQALLYDLFNDRRGRDTLRATDVEPSLRQGWPESRASSRDFFLRALAVFVDRRMQAIARTEGALIDGGIVDETLSMAARIVPQLSSAGYKLVRSLDDLAVDHLWELRELHSLPQSADWEPAERMARDATRRVLEIEEPSFALVHEAVQNVLLERYGDRVDRWGEDDMVCGRLLGSTADVAAAESLLTFLRAVHWLSHPDVGIARRTRTRSGDVMLTLVHDGFGRALNEWAESTRNTPRIRVESIVKMSGQQVLRRDVRRSEVLTPDELPRTKGLGWLGCNVVHNFRDIVFEDCDFGGTLFKRCDFENVTFHNCKLNGTLFIRCNFMGEDGIQILADREADKSVRRLQTLTFGDRCRIEGGPIVIEGYEGYGLFVDHVTAPPDSFVVRDCDIRHVGVFAESEDHLKKVKLEGKVKPKFAPEGDQRWWSR